MPLNINPKTEFVPDLVIYHGNCADGFGAALALYFRFGENVQFHAGLHGETPPDVTGRKVLIVDFSYKRSVIEKMLETAEAIFILDHHKTAADDLADLAHMRFHAFFDMNKSGAMLAWEWFMGSAVPQLIHHIQDRDLWKFEYKGTREIQAALFSYPYDFKVWADIIAGPVTNLIAEGTAIERKHFKDIRELLPQSQRIMVIGGHAVPVANLPYTMSSDAGHIMSEGHPFAACYFDAHNERRFSLRSAPDGLDVGEIAKAYGGGGHKHAASFAMPLGWEGGLPATE
jgi:oligoribonuclease NrnB/cAMP/cGMP phosphodiesterase (DHH superfamily)